MSKDLTKYLKTEKFWVKDTLGVPHPYCIGSRHVGHAADHFNGMLGTDAIEDGERKGIRCATPGCQLSFEQHEQALLVAVKDDRELSDPELQAELKTYLMSIKDMATDDHYAGFAFIRE
jgi:hypothetical protein